ncbi:hypothetical protein EXM22_16145 [Oceanispirochaeta crateris]|uniref:Signal transduction histidine kinase internal region domain-containing protein n=1 Tax=Oceanispirochaeta crateris TaxID=2518645 RepID=A0A5C1QMV4_9SPIO|nr:histidine kinase [Oceanispirochaeta crateris]QEN09435.1 hypothetical protein EXM22_16145 [Oceanispirochaeta crateris]
MKRLNLRSKSISANIAKIFLVFAFMSISISILFVYVQAFRITKAQKMEALKLSGEFISQSIDAQIRIMERTAKIILGNTKIQNALVGIQSLGEDSILERDALERDISNQVIFSTLMGDNISTEFYSSTGNLLLKSPYRIWSEENLLDGLKSPDKVYQSRFQLVSPNEHGIVDDRGNTFCIYIQPLRNLYSDGPMAFVAVLLDTFELRQVLEQNAKIINNERKNDCTIFLIDSQNELVTSNKNQLEMPRRKKDSTYIEIFSEYTNWKIVIEIPNQYLVSDMIHVQTLNAVILLVLLLSTAYGMRIRLEKKLFVLNELTAAMGSVKEGNYSIELNLENLDEDIKLVFGHFNEMSREIDDLINRVYRNRILTKEAQLKMLELQINPHFLFNSLQTIEAYGEIHDQEEVQIMASSLGSLLRYNLKANTFVYLEQELKMAKKYCVIERIRFGDRVDISFYIDERLKSMTIPKFILQPILENCFVHAFPSDTRKGKISVEGVISNENDMSISITDNGDGMEFNKIDEMNKNLGNIDESDDYKMYFNHIGLSNINYRIKIYYGEEYGITVQPGAVSGLTIMIKLPCRKNIL